MFIVAKAKLDDCLNPHQRRERARHEIEVVFCPSCRSYLKAAVYDNQYRRLECGAIIERERPVHGKDIP